MNTADEKTHITTVVHPEEKEREIESSNKSRATNNHEQKNSRGQ